MKMFSRTMYRKLFHENIRKVILGMFLFQFIVFFIFIGSLTKSSDQNEQNEKNPHIDSPEESKIKKAVENVIPTDKQLNYAELERVDKFIKKLNVVEHQTTKKQQKIKHKSKDTKKAIKSPKSKKKSEKVINKVKEPKKKPKKKPSHKKDLLNEKTEQPVPYKLDYSWNNKETLNILKEARQQEHVLFNECKPKDSLNLIGNIIKIKHLVLTNKTSQSLDDVKDISKVPLKTPIYEVTLNDEYLAQNSDEIEDMNIARGCYLKRFDKVINKTESFNSKGKLILLNALKNFQVRLMFSGFYNIKCFYLVQEPNWFQTFYNDAFVILPKNMKELQDKQKKYKQLVGKSKKKIKDRIENPLLNDPDLNECGGNKTSKTSQKKMNVLIIGIESVALNHFKRIFPVTYTFLTTSLSNNIFYERYNKIGENTYPNIVPSLTGLVIDSNIEQNITNEIRFFRDADTMFHDNLPFIWQEFEKLGYLTSLSEENGKIGMFKMKKSGFRYPPTSFYTMPFNLKLESIHRPVLCYKNEPVYQKTLKELRMFIENMNSPINSKIPYFSFNFLRYFTHEFFSVPKSFDLQLKGLIEDFESRGYLDNTLLILMSDHGSRLTKFSYQTKVGKRERSLPFFSMRLPKKLLNTEFHRNAFENKDKLFTPYDFYKTLKQFYYINKNLDGFSNWSDKCRENFSKNQRNMRHLRGVSLFEKLPKDRGCVESLIPMLYCPDEPRVELSHSVFLAKTNTTVNEAAKQVLLIINQKTKTFRDSCTPFKFKRAISIEMMKGKASDLFILQLQCKPGNAVFEAYMQVRESKLVLYNKVIRANDYKDESDCMVKDSLMGFCFCAQADKNDKDDVNMQEMNNNMDQFNFF